MKLRKPPHPLDWVDRHFVGITALWAGFVTLIGMATMSVAIAVGTDSTGFKLLYPWAVGPAIGFSAAEVIKYVTTRKSRRQHEALLPLLPKSIHADEESRTIIVERQNGEMVMLEVPEGQSPSPQWVLDQIIPPELRRIFNVHASPVLDMLNDDDD